MLFDQELFTPVEIIVDAGKPGGARAHHFNGESHGNGPVADNEASQHRAALESAVEMIPDPMKSDLGLADVENGSFVAKQVQIQSLPLRRAKFYL